jgi:hypothetical protein
VFLVKTLFLVKVSWRDVVAAILRFKVWDWKELAKPCGKSAEVSGTFQATVAPLNLISLQKKLGGVHALKYNTTEKN